MLIALCLIQTRIILCAVLNHTRRGMNHITIRNVVFIFICSSRIQRGFRNFYYWLVSHRANYFAWQRAAPCLCFGACWFASALSVSSAAYQRTLTPTMMPPQPSLTPIPLLRGGGSNNACQMLPAALVQVQV